MLYTVAIINPDQQATCTHLQPLGIQRSKLYKNKILINMEEEKEKKIKHEEFDWVKDREMGRKYWRSWGSWYSWGSPTGLGLFFIEIGAFLWLLHLANIIH